MKKLVKELRKHQDH